MMFLCCSSMKQKASNGPIFTVAVFLSACPCPLHHGHVLASTCMQTIAASMCMGGSKVPHSTHMLYHILGQQMPVRRGRWGQEELH